MNHTTITLGELLGSQNETIKRNAMSILKTLQKEKAEKLLFDYDLIEVNKNCDDMILGAIIDAQQQ